jgi:gluconolactonase
MTRVTIDVIAEDLGFVEGPVVLPDGRIAVTSISHGCVYVVDPVGAPTQRIETGGGPNGLTVDSDGVLYVAQNGGIFGASGPAEPGVQVIRDGRVEYLATGLDAPNDLVFGRDGRLWVTDTRAEIDFFAPDESKRGWVWSVDPASGEGHLVLDDGPVFINGLGFTPDAGELVVTTTCGAQLWSYPVDALDAEAGRILHAFDGGWPDGMAVTPDGAVWVALTGGHRLDLIDSGTGERLDSVDLPEGSLPTNVCLGRTPGELFVTASFHQALLSVRLDRSGALLENAEP